jgi:hypothetical protein
MLALALLIVADVGVRRVRISALEIKAGYSAIRRRLGYVDDSVGIRRRLPQSMGPRPEGTLVPGLVSTAHGTPVTIRPRTVSAVTQSSRLLAAKQRAARR